MFCSLWKETVLMPPHGFVLQAFQVFNVTGSSFLPSYVHDQVLQELHRVHLGISKIKALVRSHVWWPGTDAEIGQMTKSCASCEEFSTCSLLASMDLVITFVARIHLEFAGSFCGKMCFAIIMDAHSK